MFRQHLFYLSIIGVAIEHRKLFSDTAGLRDRMRGGRRGWASAVCGRDRWYRVGISHGLDLVF